MGILDSSSPAPTEILKQGDPDFPATNDIDDTWKAVLPCYLGITLLSRQKSVLPG